MEWTLWCCFWLGDWLLRLSTRSSWLNSCIVDSFFFFCLVGLKVKKIANQLILNYLTTKLNLFSISKRQKMRLLWGSCIVDSFFFFCLVGLKVYLFTRSSLGGDLCWATTWLRFWLRLSGGVVRGESSLALCTSSLLLLGTRFCDLGCSFCKSC